MILAILQARMSSTRLPGKVLLPLAGAPMILRQIERIKRARLIDKLVLATSTDPSDDLLAQTVERAGITVYRGALNNVQWRFAGAIREHGPCDYVVRLTADCPLTDPEVIDHVIELTRFADVDYGCNTLPRTYPKGLDVECIKAESLLRAIQLAETPEEFEHVTWRFHQRPDLYSHTNLAQWRNEGHVRWTVDTPADYDFVSLIYDVLYHLNPAFTSEAVRRLDITANQLASRPHGRHSDSPTSPCA